MNIKDMDMEVLIKCEMNKSFLFGDRLIKVMINVGYIKNVLLVVEIGVLESIIC